MSRCDREELNSFCACLSDTELDVLCPFCHVSQIKRGRYIKERGDSRVMGIVVSGAFATEVSAEDGRCFSTFVARSGNVLNLIRLVEGEPGPDTLLGGGHSAYAIVDSSVGLIPVDVVNGLCETNAHLSRLFFERAINRLRTVSDWFEKSKSLDARDRVKMLLDTLKEAGVDPSEVSHAMMGRMLGMNRVTVTRAMADVLDKSPSQ